MVVVWCWYCCFGACWVSVIVVNSVVLLNKINIYLSYLGFAGLVWICSLVLVVWIV